MIQDIAPHKLDIAYKGRGPEENSKVLIFYNGRLLTGIEQHTGEITFPTYSQLPPTEHPNTYLFQLNVTSFFYIKYDSEIEAQHIVSHITESSQGKDENNITYQWQPRQFFRTAVPKELAFAAITAMHLDGWYQKNKYCGVCGQPLIHDSKERMLRCPECNNLIYPRINPAVIVAVTHGDQLLLTKYEGRAYKNYALVAGFTEIGESFEETVAREVMEEVGLKVKNITYYKSQPWGFADNILAGYFCEVDGDPTITRDEEELSVAEWFSRDEIPVEPEDLSLTNEMIIHFKENK